jgi:hypothetical protein
MVLRPVNLCGLKSPDSVIGLILVEVVVVEARLE